MPITKSAKKALRQNKTRRRRNLARKAAVRTARKQILAEPSAKTISLAYKAIDKAAKNRIFAKKKAARLKSRLARKINTQK
jgi:small subunit ribosomal protein S20